MRNAFLILALATSLFAATNKNLPGGPVTSGNDKQVVQSSSDSLIGTSDTGFVTCGAICQTNTFNWLRNPLQAAGMPKSSSVVSANPDSIVCNFLVARKDADTSDISFGININIGTAAAPIWTLYGSSAGTGGTNVAITKYRTAVPFVVARQFRPWITIPSASATDTVRVRFVECKDK